MENPKPTLNFILVAIFMASYFLTYSQKTSRKDYSTFNKPPIERQYYRAVTIGFLQGGGSAIGIEHEEMVFADDHYSIHYGIGFNSLNFEEYTTGSCTIGVNYHFQPNIRSSMVSLSYFHQGFKESFYMNTIGMSYIFRAKKYFSAQIGLGFPINIGPAMGEATKKPPVVLLFSIGGYYLR